MNRRIAMSMLSVTAALALMGGSVFALFDTQARADNSTFSTSNPLLQIAQKIDGDHGTFFSEIPGFNVTGLTPGNPKQFSFFLRNASTDTALNLSTVFGNTIGSGVGGSAPGSLEQDLHVGLVCNNVGAVADDPIFADYETLAGQIITGALAPGAISECTMTLALPKDNTTDANQSLIFNAVFNGATVINPS